MVLGDPVPSSHPSMDVEEHTDRVHLELVEPTGSQRIELSLPFAAIGPSVIRLSIRERSPLGESLARVAKRSIDALVAASVLTVLGPVMIALAVAIKADSNGPVFYRHTRLGRHGQQITVWKFRSMRIDIPDEVVAAAMSSDHDRIESPVYKSPNDPRITSVGRFIRRTGLDELPQLFNVVTGSMSLVGPRPLVDEEVAELSPAQYRYRNSVLPGVTGLWQVFRRFDTSFSERIRLDLVYVGCHSLWLDVYLLMMTPLALLRGDRSF